MSKIPAWHEAYPPPRNTSPSTIERQELLAQLQMGKQPGVDFLLVDLRRTDYEVLEQKTGFLLIRVIKAKF
jgi:arsenical-resistance protein 2